MVNGQDLAQCLATTSAPGAVDAQDGLSHFRFREPPQVIAAAVRLALIPQDDVEYRAKHCLKVALDGNLSPMGDIATGCTFEVRREMSSPAPLCMETYRESLPGGRHSDRSKAGAILQVRADLLRLLKLKRSKDDIDFRIFQEYRSHVP
jgi:hypothetical protein